MQKAHTKSIKAKQEPRTMKGKNNEFDLWQIISGTAIAVVVWLIVLLAVNGTQAKTPEAAAKTETEAVATLDNYPGGIDAINAYRAQHAAQPIKLNDELSRSAQAKAEYIAESGDWAHVSKDGTEPWDYILDAGYEYTTAGENLAKCWNSPTAIAEAWYNSPTHKDVMLGEYEHVGFGEALGTNGCSYVVAHFGSTDL